jgi:hypothetical protein
MQTAGNSLIGNFIATQGILKFIEIELRKQRITREKKCEYDYYCYFA